MREQTASIDEGNVIVEPLSFVAMGGAVVMRQRQFWGRKKFEKATGGDGHFTFRTTRAKAATALLNQ